MENDKHEAEDKGKRKKEKKTKTKNTNFKCAYKFHIEETEMPN